jgi:hypothetical protein
MSLYIVRGNHVTKYYYGALCVLVFDSGNIYTFRDEISPVFIPKSDGQSVATEWINRRLWEDNRVEA